MMALNFLMTLNPRYIALKKVSIDGYHLRYISSELQDDKEVVTTSVKENGWVLEYASPRLRDDKEVVTTAITKECWALKYASPRLRDDKELVIKSVSQCGNTLEYASPRLQDDIEVVTAAVKSFGDSLKHASKRFQDDKEMVLKACKHCNFLSLYISSRLQKDRDVIIANARNNNNSFQHSSLELRSDKEYVLAVVKYCGEKLQYASEELKSDFDVVKASCQNRYRRGGMDYKREEKTKYEKNREKLFDAGFVKNEYGKNLYNRDSGFCYASYELRSDEDIVSFAMLQSHGKAFYNATKEIRDMGIFDFIQKQIEKIRSPSCTIIISKKIPDLVAEIITSYYTNSYTTDLVKRWLVIKKHHENIGIRSFLFT